MSQKLPDKIIQLVESLDPDQLHALYNVVAERLNLVHRMHALHAMQNFSFMDRVSFTHNGQYYEGIVTRLNQKTITVVLDNGSRWNVSPGSLTKLETESPLKKIILKEQCEKLNKKK